MKTFKTSNGDKHLIDNANNHFINGKCVNPLENNSAKIGSTVPNKSEQKSVSEQEWFNIQKTGSVPFEIDEEGRFIRL